MVIYGADQRPLFIGHYWLNGTPRAIAPNIACLDYSAVKSGRLVAYRFDGETQLHQDKFVWVYKDPWQGLMSRTHEFDKPLTGLIALALTRAPVVVDGGPRKRLAITV